MPLTDEQQLKCARIFASLWTEFLDGDHDETTQMYIDSSELVEEFQRRRMTSSIPTWRSATRCSVSMQTARQSSRSSKKHVHST